MFSPFVMIIFGATGDLAINKLFPALLSLYKQGNLGKKFYIVGFARRPFDDNSFTEFIENQLNLSKEENKIWQDFSKKVYYQSGTFEKENGYKDLVDMLAGFDKEVGACITRIFYLATPPDNYNTILDFLSKTKLSEGCGQKSDKWTKLAIEKPFGKDLESAQDLDKKLSSIFAEKQIFRVDHYLAKETVQNMVAFRFANGIFEPVWNNKYIDHVQITWAEKKGVGNRGKFFDGVGLLRDVMQNHLMQLISSVAMEQPKSFSREDMRTVRADVIKSIRCVEEDEVCKFTVRGQYAGFRNEKDIDSASKTETFVALKLFVDTPRFKGVPFYVRAGKKMPKDVVEISIVFIQTCHILFKEFGCPEIGNVLTIRIQPDEGISLRVIAKKPSGKLSLGTVNMKFSYQEEFGTKGKDAYQKLLLDVLSGDQMLFNRSDELASSWTFITKILKGWEKNSESRIRNYELETWGPKEANELIEKDGRKWL